MQRTRIIGIFASMLPQRANISRGTPTLVIPTSTDIMPLVSTEALRPRITTRYRNALLLRLSARDAIENQLVSLGRVVYAAFVKRYGVGIRMSTGT